MLSVPGVEVKLFIGRVPKSQGEAELKMVFAPFGEVTDCCIIRDKASTEHKGCGFVKMRSLASADAAIRALNNIHSMDPSLGPLQVKYATGEAERLGLPGASFSAGMPGAEAASEQLKLFVGSLPKAFGDEEVRSLFAAYGEVTEVFVMRDAAKESKGCAFVKFASKDSAFFAIQNCNGKVTPQGGIRPIEVRFAEKKAAGQPGSTFGGRAAVPAPKVWIEYFTPEGRPYYYNSQTSQTQWERPAEMDAPPPAAASSAGGAAGPPGANVFIFHVPNDWTEGDLRNHFSHYGQMVSCRLSTDPSTGRNKGFGFVSYTSIPMAIAAVNGMNGFQVNADGKRLKVQIKKGEEQYAAAVNPMMGQQPMNTNMMHMQGGGGPMGGMGQQPQQAQMGMPMGGPMGQGMGMGQPQGFPAGIRYAPY